MKTYRFVTPVLATVVLLLIASSAAQAATRSVPSATYPTIKDAIDAADPGDTISIAPGTYKENDLIVEKNGLIFIGHCAAPGAVVIDGSEKRNVEETVARENDGLEIYADDVEVRCLTLRHWDNDCIEVAGSDLFVYKTHFENCDDSGIESNLIPEDCDCELLGFGGECEEEDCDPEAPGLRVVASEFLGVGYPVYAGGDGISVTSTNLYLTGDDAFYIHGDNLTLHDIVVDVADGSCVDLEGDGASIQRVHCKATSDGFDIDGDDNLIRDNSLHTVTDDGICVDGDNNTVESNVVSNTECIGIEVDGNDNVIRWNTASATRDDLCFCLSGDRMLIEGNAARDCGESGFDVSGDDFELKDNSVVGIGYDEPGYDIDCLKRVPAGNPVNCSAALISGNTSDRTGPNGDEGFDVSGENLTFANNTTERASGDGMCLALDDSIIEYNDVFHSSTDGYEAFDIDGDRNTIRGNFGEHNASAQCMEIDGTSNTITSNTCRYNLADGFLVDGNNNVLELNVAQNNGGEGIENSGTANSFIDNTSTGNRTNCAEESVGDSLAVDSGNNCGSDGSDFTTLGEIDP